MDLNTFNVFRDAVAKQFERMKKHQLFRANVGKDVMWNTYLASFPPGSDPMYNERTEHDCNTCRQFIRAVGNVVAIINGKKESIWDVKAGDPNYQAVTDALASLVKSANIENVFLHYERVAGVEKNFQNTIDGIKTWSHFFINLPQSYVVHGDAIASMLGETASTHDVFARGLNEITMDSIETVLELIDQNVIYRGTEHKFVVTEFRKLKAAYAALAPIDQDNFVWSQIKTPTAVAKIRGTMIGTLLVDLSTGVDLDDAVRSYEHKAAPANYKRPTAAVTQGMIKKAREAITSLGLTSALERRYATIHDITINNVLFADRSTTAILGGDVFDDLAAKVTNKKPKALDKVDTVSIEQFVNNILPHAESIEVMVENRHSPNFVSLIAPVDVTARQLFKWPNNFSWSYTGDVADSMAQRVKAAGGNITGDLCCRLGWYNHDDLDLSMVEPDGHTVYFGNRHHLSPCGGALDVDMNAGAGTTRKPVENIVYKSRTTMKEGVYTLRVHNYRKREDEDVGFDVEVDFLGTTYTFTHAAPVPDRTYVTVIKFEYSKANGIKVIESLLSTQATRTIWNVATESFHKVNAIMLSPNFWDDLAIGNKHWFFMLDKCANDGQARGFFNEFLISDLDKHRKVIEMVGAKMKTDNSDRQLSGLGFSSTQCNELLCRVKGNFTRLVKIVF